MRKKDRKKERKRDGKKGKKMLNLRCEMLGYVVMINRLFNCC